MNFNFKTKNYHFSPNWLFCILTVIAICIFISLGIWQLERAKEKKIIIKNTLAKQQEEPVSFSLKSKNPEQFQKIRLQGNFLSEFFLLDNQHHKHQYGFNVIVPFKTFEQGVVLIDIGFIPKEGNRQQLPKINLPHDSKIITGSVYYPSSKSFVLGETYEKVSDTTALIQKIDINLISKVLQKSIYPYIIRLDKSEPFGFIREWVVISMSPQKHYGYAFQWFTFALVALIIFIGLNLKKK